MMRQTFFKSALRRLRDEGEEAARVVDQNGVNHFLFHAGLEQLRHEHRRRPALGGQIERPGASVIRGQQQSIRLAGVEERQKRADSYFVRRGLPTRAIEADPRPALGDLFDQVRPTIDE